MGFGYFWIGYLVAFVFFLPAKALGFGFAAELIGYGLMLYGLLGLRRYHPAFRAAIGMQIPLFLTALYDAGREICAFFSLSPGLFGISAVQTGAEIGTTLFVILFHLAFLYAIRGLSEEVGLKKLSVLAMRNALVVLVYAVFYALCRFPFPEAVLPYLTIAQVIFRILWVILNLWLLLSCTKDICPDGEEELPPKKSRFAWLNRMEETYERNHQALADQARRDGEALAQRNRDRRERRNRKKRK